MINYEKQEITVVYGLHNFEQILILLYNICFSFKLNNKNNNDDNITLLILISKELNIYSNYLKEYCYRFVDKVEIRIEDSIHESVYTPGKFYWLNSPFLKDSKYFLQVDNDLFIDFNIRDFFKEHKNLLKNNYFLGVHDDILTRYKNHRYTNTVEKNIGNDFVSKHNSKYINTGLVAMGPLLREKYSSLEYKNKLFGKIEEMVSLFKKKYESFEYTGFDSDQNLIFLLFNKKINSSLKNEFNTFMIGDYVSNLIENNMEIKLKGIHLTWWNGNVRFNFMNLFTKDNFENFLESFTSELKRVFYEKEIEEKSIQIIAKNLWDSVFKYNHIFIKIMKEFEKSI